MSDNIVITPRRAVVAGAIGGAIGGGAIPFVYLVAVNASEPSELIYFFVQPHTDLYFFGILSVVGAILGAGLGGLAGAVAALLIRSGWRPRRARFIATLIGGSVAAVALPIFVEFAFGPNEPDAWSLSAVLDAVLRAASDIVFVPFAALGAVGGALGGLASGWLLQRRLGPVMDNTQR